jgi:hypothetical protein
MMPLLMTVMTVVPFEVWQAFRPLLMPLSA